MFKKTYPKFIYLLLLIVSVSNNKIFAQCGTAPTAGSVTISIANNIVNTYYPGLNTPAAGATSLTVGTADSRGNSTPVSNGDLVIIIQVQGADMNTSNTDSYGDNVAGPDASGYLGTNLRAGYYEYNTVASVSGSTINFLYQLANSYYDMDFTVTTGIRRYQVIRVPRYYDFKIRAGASVTCPSWNGNTGGVVAIDAQNKFTLSGLIDVSSKGFRGGGGKNLTGATARNTNGAGPLTNTDYRWNSPLSFAPNQSGGAKGEGIAGTPAYYFEYGTTLTVTAAVEGYVDGSMGRGAPGNAGGGATDGSPVGGGTANQFNAGGGGGGNGGTGGHGGSGWHGGAGNVNTYPTGGYGGAAFAQAITQRICFGGGGGAGSANNSVTSNEYSCSGGGGGGIIITRAIQYAGNGSAFANGSNAPGVTATYTPAQVDGAGGGGAGGSIIMVTTQGGAAGLNNISAFANGGDGGDMTNYYDYGPGGGGGGGVIVSNGAFLLTNVFGGYNGQTRSNSVTGPVDNDYGSTPGADGKVITLSDPPELRNSINPASPCGTLPVTLTDFSAKWNGNKTVSVLWKVTNEIHLNHFEVEYSVDGILFSKLAVVKYAEGIAGYNYIHSGPALMNYYRLRMVDDDGKFSYSKIVRLQLNSLQNPVVLMYPNPAYNKVTLQLTASQNEKAVITLVDNSGRIVINKTAALTPGLNYLSIDEIEKLAASVYFVKIKSTSIDTVEKLIIGKK